MANLNIPANPSVGTTYEENGVIYTWTGTHWTASVIETYASGPLAGFRNHIINGDFRVRQRGNNFNHLSGTNGYFADRWVGNGANGEWNAALDTANFPAGFSQSYTMTADTIRQFIELPGAGDRGIFTVGSTWTVSIWANSNNVDRCQFIFADSSSSRSNDVFVGNAAFTSTGESSNGFTRYSGSLTLPATAPAGTNLCLMLNFVFDSKVDTKVVGAQLEPGPVATPFEHRPIGTELALCQRYYQQELSSGGFDYFVPANSANSATNIRFFRNYTTTMRVIPTVTITGYSAIGRANNDLATNSGSSTAGINFTFTCAAGDGEAAMGAIEWTANAEL